MSGYKGVEINGVDTLEKWGLILLADLKIGNPPLKQSFVEIPGRDGALNTSYVISGGEPIYGNREISFSLFTRENSERALEIHSELSATCHGRECTLKLPVDKEHYFKGLFAVGDTEGYNNGKFPVLVNAEPYKYKNELTVYKGTLPESGEITLFMYNEMRRVIPTFTFSGTVTVDFNGTKYTVSEGTTQISGIKLFAGKNKITLSGIAGTEFSVSYREGTI